MTLQEERLPEGLCRLVLNRPQVANALDRALHAALVQALEASGRDATLRALLLEGAGNRTFSGGADLRESFGLPEVEARALRRQLLLRTLLAVLDCPRPVLAVIHHKAVGGGAMLALLADEVWMAEGASLSMPEIALGMPSPMGAAIVAVRGGRSAAQALIQAGLPMGAPAARAHGLADAVHPTERLDALARAQAARLGGLDAAAFAANKRFLNAPLRAALVQAAEAAGQMATEAVADAR